MKIRIYKHNRRVRVQIKREGKVEGTERKIDKEETEKE